jgi:AraC-like DNA-binding protein
MPRYPWELLPKLVVQIELCQQGRAHDLLDKLLDIIFDDGRNRLNYRKLRCAQIISAMLRAGYRGGAASKTILAEHYTMLERLTASRNRRSIRVAMHAYLDTLLDHVRPSQHTDMEILVNEIREHMTKSLDRPRSLGQYADAAHISAGHLSRSFTAIIGHPFREEMQQLRMAAARQLLEETSMKVHAISRRVGLADPSQFIAQFRRATGMTPAWYRRHRRTDRAPREQKGTRLARRPLS